MMFADATSVAADGNVATEQAKAAAPPRDDADQDDSWTEGLLSVRGGFSDALGRMIGAVGLSALFGVAIGARDGGMALAIHGLGVPAAFVAVLTLGVPALAIVLALFDAPITGTQTARCAARGATAAGLTMAGLAPAMALFVVSSESTLTAAAVAALGLAIAGVVGARHLQLAFSEMLQDAPPAKRSVTMMVLAAFVLFAAVLAARVWMSTVPLLGGVL